MKKKIFAVTFGLALVASTFQGGNAECMTCAGRNNGGCVTTYTQTSTTSTCSSSEPCGDCYAVIALSTLN